MYYYRIVVQYELVLLQLYDPVQLLCNYEQYYYVELTKNTHIF